MLRSGVFGCVKAKVLDGVKVAVKTCRRDDDVSSKESHRNSPLDLIPTSFILETSVMKKLDHSYTMNILDASIDEEGLCKIMMPCGISDLNKFVHEGHFFNIRDMGEKIALGLLYLENKNIFHGDIKPENIIIMEDFTPKIADFGLAVVNVSTFDALHENVNTLHYKPPEMFTYSGFNYSAYSWVFGLLMYFMSNRENLFNVDSLYEEFTGGYLKKIFGKIGGSQHWDEQTIKAFNFLMIERDVAL